MPESRRTLCLGKWTRTAADAIRGIKEERRSKFSICWTPSLELDLLVLLEEDHIPTIIYPT